MKKKVIMIVVSLFLIIAIGVTLFVVKQQQELRQKAAPATTLALSPSQTTKKVGDTFTLNVMVDTGENSIVNVASHITFDSTKLKALRFTNSPQFPNITSKEDLSQKDRASLGVATLSISQPFSGSGIVATIEFEVLGGSDTPLLIKFAPDTFVGSLAEGSTNALIGSSPATITVSGDGAGTSPTSTPSVSGTPTPTTPITGTPTKTPTVTPRPTGSLSPTPTTADSSSGSAVFSVTNPANNATVASDPPSFQGRAPAGNTVTVVLSPGNVTGAVTSSSGGSWVYIPDDDLGNGTYTAIISSSNTTTGATETTTITFTVNSGSTALTSTTPTPTPTAEIADTSESETIAQETVPVTGDISYTLGIIATAILFIAAGSILPFMR